jgi:hypothetical protein
LIGRIIKYFKKPPSRLAVARRVEQANITRRFRLNDFGAPPAKETPAIASLPSYLPRAQVNDSCAVVLKLIYKLFQAGCANTYRACQSLSRRLDFPFQDLQVGSVFRQAFRDAVVNSKPITLLL